jgi:hypothetical protein
LRARDIAQFRIRHARPGIHIQLNILLLRQHAHAVFRQFPLQTAVRRIQQRHQQRIGEDHSGRIVYQHASQRQCVFRLRIRRGQDDRHDSSDGIGALR